MPITADINGAQREIRKYALEVLRENGCPHDHTRHDFFADRHTVVCIDCGETHQAMYSVEPS